MNRFSIQKTLLVALVAVGGLASLGASEANAGWYGRRCVTPSYSYCNKRFIVRSLFRRIRITRRSATTTTRTRAGVLRRCTPRSQSVVPIRTAVMVVSHRHIAATTVGSATAVATGWRRQLPTGSAVGSGSILRCNSTNRFSSDEGHGLFRGLLHCGACLVERQFPNVFARSPARTGRESRRVRRDRASSTRQTAISPVC